VIFTLIAIATPCFFSMSSGDWCYQKGNSSEKIKK